jgi:hypothetical protein
LLNIIKTIKCSHDYKLYNIEKILEPYPSRDLQFNYKFICVNCKKHFNISYKEIIEIIKECKEEFNKLFAIEKIDISLYKKISFSIHPIDDIVHCYEGEYINLVIKKLNKKGIKTIKNKWGSYIIKGTEC